LQQPTLASSVPRRCTVTAMCCCAVGSEVDMDMEPDDRRAAMAAAAAAQGLILVHSLAQREHFLWDTLVDVSLSMAKTAQGELKGGRV